MSKISDKAVDDIKSILIKKNENVANYKFDVYYFKIDITKNGETLSIYYMKYGVYNILSSSPKWLDKLDKKITKYLEYQAI